jgi:transposase InsO family protein
MSRRANCCDNASTKSLFKTPTVERVFQLRYETRDQARLDTVAWIEGFYNHARLHSSIGFRIPVRIE